MTLRPRALALTAAFLILAACSTEPANNLGGHDYNCQANLRDANGHGPLVTENPVTVTQFSVDAANTLCADGFADAAVAQDKIAAQNGIANTDYVGGCSCVAATNIPTGSRLPIPTAP